MSTLMVRGVDLYYEETGQGTPILWLQGLGADHAAWAPQVARFSARFRCLAPDNRGSGRTAPGDEPLTLAAMALDAADLLAARAGGEPAHVVGLSMGASIAQELTLHAPDRVRSLVLVSGFARTEPRLRELLLAWREIYPRVSPVAFQRLANVFLFSWRFFERPRAVAGTLSFAGRASAPPEWFLAQLAASMEHDAAERLGQLRVPTLVLAGAEDTMIPPRLGRELAACIPGAVFAEIAEAGHSLNLEQQRPFNESIGTFFDAH